VNAVEVIERKDVCTIQTSEPTRISTKTDYRHPRTPPTWQTWRPYDVARFDDVRESVSDVTLLRMLNARPGSEWLAVHRWCSSWKRCLL